VQHLVTPDPTPSPADQLTMDFPIPVHRHEPVRVDHHDVTGQRLVTSTHPAGGTGFDLPVCSGGEKPASQRSPQDRADRPDPEPVAMSVDVLDHQRRVGSSREAKKADALDRISFARRSRAFSRRSRLSSPDSSGPAVLAVSALACQRRSDSAATPRSFATPCNAFVSDA